MENLKYLVAYLFSRSLFFSITLDEKFHEISNKNDINIEKLRISLFSLGLGVKKLYFFTFKKEEKFKFFKMIRLEDIQVIPSEEIIQEKAEQYEEHINSNTEEDIAIEIEFLQYRINQEENKKNIALNKLNNYIAIISIVIPLLTSNIINSYLQIKFKYKMILLIIAIYTLINVVLCILDFLKVRLFIRSSFRDVKESNKHKNKLAESYYSDWYTMKEESTVYVSIVRNTERYLKLLIASISLILVLGNLNNIYKVNIDSDDYKLVVNNNIVNINLEDNQINKEDLKKLSDIHDKLLNDNIKEIIIIKNVPNGYITEEKYNNIYNSLEMYNINKTNIIVITEKNDEFKKQSSLKIVLLGGEK